MPSSLSARAAENRRCQDRYQQQRGAEVQDAGFHGASPVRLRMRLCIGSEQQDERTASQVEIPPRSQVDRPRAICSGVDYPKAIEPIVQTAFLTLRAFRPLMGQRPDWAGAHIRRNFSMDHPVQDTHCGCRSGGHGGRRRSPRCPGNSTPAWAYMYGGPGQGDVDGHGHRGRRTTTP